MHEKELIRKQLLTRRNKLTKDEVVSKSNIIQHALERHSSFQQAHTILFYVSYGHEVFTHDLIKTYITRDKTILVPYSNTETCRITPVKITKWNELVKGSYGILEPQHHTLYKENIDLIILPGVGFDRNGNRLGHGKGYYDRLITRSKTTPLIGLAYDFQIIPTIPTQSHDRPVDIIITETETITCTKQKD